MFLWIGLIFLCPGVCASSASLHVYTHTCVNDASFCFMQLSSQIIRITRQYVLEAQQISCVVFIAVEMHLHRY